MPVRFIVDQLTSMRNQLVYHSMLGEYKEYVALRKEFAKKFITYPDEAKYIAPTRVNLSIFSKMGRNTIKIWFKELFRKKTPEEKEMQKLAYEQKVRQKSGWIG